MHIPVMLSEVIKYLDIRSNGIYIDSTFGLGGHSHEMLKYLNSDGRLYIFDKDIDSYNKANDLFYLDDRVNVFHSSFDDMYLMLKKPDVIGNVSGIIADLGLSLFQLKSLSKGFGFNCNGFLDMRLDTNQAFRVVDWINFATKKDLEDVFVFFDDSLLVKFLVKKIILYRNKHSIKTTKELFDIIFGVFGFYKGRSMIGKLFQFIRVFINNDFSLLHVFLKRCLSLLDNGGILILISFNSLEDMVIKNFLLNSHRVKSLSFKPSICEIDDNYSARSAHMRIIERI